MVTNMEKILNQLSLLKIGVEGEIAILMVVIVLLALSIVCLTIIKKLKDK